MADRPPEAAARSARLRRWLPLLVPGALAALLLALAAWIRPIDAEAHAELAGLLRRLRQLDAAWDVEVLRVKTGLTASYGAVPSPLPVADALESLLHNQAGSLWGGADEAAARMQALAVQSRQLLDRKTELIERFKTQHAALRSATQKLPAAAVEAASGLDALPAAQRVPVVQAVQDMLVQTLAYLNLPDAAVAARIADALNRLRDHVAPLPPEGAARVGVFAALASAVLAQEQQTDRLLRDLAAVPTAATLEAFSDAQVQEQLHLLQPRRWLRLGLLVAGAALLLVWALAWRRALRAERQAARAQTDLKRTQARLKDLQAHQQQADKLATLGWVIASQAQQLLPALSRVRGSLGDVRERLAPLQALLQHGREFAQLMRGPREDRERFNREFKQFEQAVHGLSEQQVLEEVDLLLQDGIGGVSQADEGLSQLLRRLPPERAELAEFSVHEALDDALAQLRPLLKSRAEVQKDYGPLPPVLGSAVQITQAFLQLLSNAAQAVPEGGAEAGRIQLRTRLHGPQAVRIEVQDNGSGIAADLLPRLFEPFVSTRHQGQGLGLVLVQRIVQAHGGQVLVESRPGAGAMFTVLLPLRPPGVAAMPPTRQDITVPA